MIQLLLGLSLGLAFLPFAAEPGQIGRWACALILLPCLPLAWDGPGRRMAEAWLLWAALTLLWSPAPLSGLDWLWKLGVVMMAVAAGRAAVTLTPLFAGFALAMAVNGALALAQLTGFPLIEQAVAPAGLFGNKNYLGEAAAAALWASPLWAVPGALLALIASGSKGAVLAALLPLLTFLPRWRKPALLAVPALGLLALPAFADHVSVAVRLEQWSLALENLSPFGHGLGSFWALFPSWGAANPHAFSWNGLPHHPHNELVSWLSDLGLGAVFPLALVFLAVKDARHDDPAFRALLAILGAACFAFPLWNPATAVLFGLLVGHLLGAGPVPGLRGLRPSSGDRTGRQPAAA